MGPNTAGSTSSADTPRTRGPGRHAVIVAIIVMLGLLASLAVSIGVARTERAERQATLDGQADSVGTAVDRSLEEAIQTVTTVRGLFRVDHDPTNAQFVRFLRSAVPTSRVAGDIRFNGLPAVAFIRHVRPAQARSFIEHKRAEGLGDRFADLPRDDDSYVFALHTNRDSDVLGADVRPIATRRSALETARDRAAPVVSEWVVPITDRGVDPSKADQIALVYVPVYRDRVVPATIAERRKSLVGWAAVAIRASALVATATSDGASRYDVTLYDGPATAQNIVRSTAATTVGDDRPSAIRSLSVGEGTWTLVVTDRATSSKAAATSPLSVFGAGVLLTLLTALLTTVLGQQRRRVERQVIKVTADLRESEQSLRRMADAVPVGIFDIDLDTCETFFNQAFREVAEESWLSADDDAHATLRDRIMNSARAGQPFVDRFQTTGPDATSRWLEVRATGIRDDRGRVRRILGSVADVTADATLESRLGDARDSALANARMKSEFLANMSHEIRTPLNGVLGLATLMLDDELSAIQRERLVTLRDAGQDLLILLNDILDFSKMEAGRLKLEQVPFSLGAVIDQVTTLHASTANDKQIALRHRVDDRIGPVVGDPARLRQVLQNLVGNALKFTDEGRVDVIAELKDEDEERRVVYVAVRDTGIGISDEQQRAIFSAFTQADTSTTRLYGGSGLGLAICRQIIDLMRGVFQVESEVGQGSTFSFTIPLGVADHVVELDDPDPLVPVSDVPGRAPTTTSRATVLLVEDNRVNQQVAVGMLAKLGFTADVASDGLEALDALQRVRYDLVLMDCQMPRLDGYEATAHIRAMEGRNAHTPIIAMTAAAMRGDKERCLAAGMDDYISKPVAVDELSDAIRRTLSRLRSIPAAVAEVEHADTHTDLDADTETDTDTGPPLDPAVVDQLRGMRTEDGTLFDRVRAMFLRTSATAIDDARAAAAEGDWAQVGQVLHKTRGGAATIGATTFVEVSHTVEALIADGADEHELHAGLAAVGAELARLHAALAHDDPGPQSRTAPL